MPKNSFPAAAEGMPNSIRRALLQGIGSAAAIGGLVVPPAAASVPVQAVAPDRSGGDSLQQVINAHKVARAALERSCWGIDRWHLGQEPSKAAWRRYHRACKAEGKALTAVCAYCPRDRAGAAVKARYLRKFVEWGELQDDHILALIYAGVRS